MPIFTFMTWNSLLPSWELYIKICTWWKISPHMSDFIRQKSIFLLFTANRNISSCDPLNHIDIITFIHNVNTRFIQMKYISLAILTRDTKEIDLRYFIRTCDISKSYLYEWNTFHWLSSHIIQRHANCEYTPDPE